MQVQDVMTKDAQYTPLDTSLKEAAETMRDLDCGFLPIGNEDNTKLLGVVTDRDIVIRAVAEGKDPTGTPVTEAMSKKVLYCFAEDNLEQAAESMQSQQVYRLIVLDNAERKNLCGVISLGDILRHQEIVLSADTAEAIAA